ncbi:MAG: isopentenyl-diphosphate delta-isomerase, partial [bacterium]
EHELCSVWACSAEAEAIHADADEIAAWRFCAVGEFEAELRRAPDDFTPWLKLEWPRVRAYHAQCFAPCAR